MVTEVSSRQLAILQHLRRYRISVRPVLDRLFYASRPDGCRADLEQLRRQSLIQVVTNAIQDATQPHVRYSYYALLPAGAMLLGLPRPRASRVGSDALTRHLAHLYYCCFSRRRRHRLLDDELRRLFQLDSAAPSAPLAASLAIPGFHCLERQGDRFIVQQLYSPNTSATDILIQIRRRIQNAEEHPLLRDALRAHLYGIVVLTASRELQAEVRRLLDQEYRGSGMSLTVSLAPGSWQLARSKS